MDFRDDSNMLDKSTANPDMSPFMKTVLPSNGSPHPQSASSAPAPSEVEPPVLVEDDAAVEGEQFAKVTTCVNMRVFLSPRLVAFVSTIILFLTCPLFSRAPHSPHHPPSSSFL